MLDGDGSAAPGGVVGDQAEDRAHGAGQRPPVQDGGGLARPQLTERPVGRGDGLPEQVEQSLLERGDVRLVVEVGVDVHGDAQARALGTVVDVDGQVVDGARGDVVDRAAVSGEPQVVLEGHDVDARPGQPALSSDESEVAPQLFVAVALVRQAGAQFAGDPYREVPQTVRRGDRHAQGQDVADHAGNAE